jgi:hypothetical protein
MRIIYGIKIKKGIGHKRKVHNKDLHNLKFSPNIIEVIKLRKTRCAGHDV